MPVHGAIKHVHNTTQRQCWQGLLCYSEISSGLAAGGGKVCAGQWRGGEDGKKVKRGCCRVGEEKGQIRPGRGGISKGRLSIILNPLLGQLAFHWAAQISASNLAGTDLHILGHYLG